MSPLHLLQELNLLTGNKTVLDVGTKNGDIAAKFSELDMTVDAIDICSPKKTIKGVNFEKTSVEDFLQQNTKRYDITICRHVLHHLTQPKEVMKQLSDISRVFFFTCFGPQDDWANKVSTLTHEEVLQLFKPEAVRHHSEAFQYGKTYTGDTKFWHINTFVINNGEINTASSIKK